MFVIGNITMTKPFLYKCSIQASELHVSAMEAPDPLLVIPVVLSAIWALFLLFYSSRVLAAAVQLIANLVLKDSGIHIGQYLCQFSADTEVCMFSLKVLCT